MANNIIFRDNSAAVLKTMKNKAEAALTECGLMAVGHARESAPVGSPQSTGIDGYHGGKLKNSIDFKLTGDECYIGTDVPYAIFVELGTGIYTPGGRNTPWVWFDKNGSAHKTHGMPPAHFLKNSLDSHKLEYLRVMKCRLEN